VLRTDLGDREELTRRFRSEIKLARRVTHPNVCRIHEYGEDGTLRYISMELIEGTDLKQLLRVRGRLPTAEAYDVAIQIADGLQAIHRIGVVHATSDLERHARRPGRRSFDGLRHRQRFDSVTIGGAGRPHPRDPEY
jgi:tRNA A-37 threonylcarbamoyl transferase component Bud32